MSTTNPILLTVFVFTLLPLIIAEVARKNSFPTAEDFFLRSRNMSTSLTFFTVYATWMSVFGFLGATSYFYENGPVYLTAIAWDLFFGLLFFVLGRRIWYYGKKQKYITPTNFFNDIYSSKVLSIMITLVLVVFSFPYLQIQLSGGAYLIEVATQGTIPWRVSGMLFYAIIVIYLWAGGLRAVAMTDVFYGICLFLSMLTIGFYLVDRAGGIEYVFKEIEAINHLNVVLPGPQGKAGPALWICMFLAVPLGVIMSPQMWIRSYSVKKEKTFKIMPLLLGFTAIQGLGLMLAGSAGIILEPNMGQPDKLIPTLLMAQGQTILCGILFCGIASAALSTANSQVHALATLYTIDFHKKYINPKASDKSLLRTAKLAIVIISSLAYGLLLKNPSIIMNTGIIAFSGISQIFIPTMGALFWKRSNSKAAIVGLATGIFTLVMLTFYLGIDPTYSAIIALLANGILFVLLSLVLKTEGHVRDKIEFLMNDFKNRKL